CICVKSISSLKIVKFVNAWIIPRQSHIGHCCLFFNEVSYFLWQLHNSCITSGRLCEVAKLVSKIRKRSYFAKPFVVSCPRSGLLSNGLNIAEGGEFQHKSSIEILKLNLALTSNGMRIFFI